MIHTFLIAWNEEDIIKFTLKHYLKFGPVTVYDNHSTDRTAEICRKMGAEVSLYGNNELNDREYLKIKNNCWRSSDADYVIVCDADEILQTTPEFLKKEHDKGVTIFKTFGFNIFSEKLPRYNWSELTKGLPDPNYSKNIIFSPKLQNINYSYGCHQCIPQGRVIHSDTIIPLFHYRNAGGGNRLVNRYRQYKKRMSDINKRLGLGSHYLIDEHKKKREWENCYKSSVKFSPDIIC